MTTEKSEPTPIRKERENKIIIKKKDSKIETKKR